MITQRRDERKNDKDKQIEFFLMLIFSELFNREKKIKHRNLLVSSVPVLLSLFFFWNIQMGLYCLQSDQDFRYKAGVRNNIGG